MVGRHDKSKFYSNRPIKINQFEEKSVHHFGCYVRRTPFIPAAIGRNFTNHSTKIIAKLESSSNTNIRKHTNDKCISNATQKRQSHSVECLRSIWFRFNLSSAYSHCTRNVCERTAVNSGQVNLLFAGARKSNAWHGNLFELKFGISPTWILAPMHIRLYQMKKCMKLRKRRQLANLDSYYRQPDFLLILTICSRNSIEV